MNKEDNEPLGFSGSGYEYMRLLPEQKESDEFFEIRDFLSFGIFCKFPRRYFYIKKLYRFCISLAFAETLFV